MHYNNAAARLCGGFDNTFPRFDFSNHREKQHNSSCKQRSYRKANSVFKLKVILLRVKWFVNSYLQSPIAVHNLVIFSTPLVNVQLCKNVNNYLGVIRRA